MKPRKSDPLLVVPPTWDELKELLKTDYTVTVRDICSDLHISRQFFDSAIRPFLRKIYVAGIIKDKNDQYINRPFLKQLQKEGIISGAESTYYNENDYINLIDTVTTYTQRSKPIYVDDYIIPDSDLFPKYLKQMEEVKRLERILNTAGSSDPKGYRGTLTGLTEARKQAEAIFYEMLSATGKKLMDSRVYTTNRTAAEYMKLELDASTFLEGSPKKGGEILGWGTTNEQNMRHVFDMGMIRCELRFPGDSKDSSIVRYIPDPDPYIYRNKNPEISKTKIIVPVKVWEEIKNRE